MMVGYWIWRNLSSIVHSVRVKIGVRWFGGGGLWRVVLRLNLVVFDTLF